MSNLIKSIKEHDELIMRNLLMQQFIIHIVHNINISVVIKLDIKS